MTLQLVCNKGVNMIHFHFDPHFEADNRILKMPSTQKYTK